LQRTQYGTTQLTPCTLAHALLAALVTFTAVALGYLSNQRSSKNTCLFLVLEWCAVEVGQKLLLNFSYKFALVFSLQGRQKRVDRNSC